MKTTKKSYLSPQIKAAEVDLEGVICESTIVTESYVDEIHNVTAEDPTITGEGFYYEF